MEPCVCDITGDNCKALCWTSVTAVFFIFLILPIKLSFALWSYLTKAKKWICKRQKSQHFVKQICLPSVTSNVTNSKNELWKTLRLTSCQKPTITIHYNLLHAYPSVPSFVFTVLLIPSSWPSFNVLSSLFLWFTQFVGRFLLLEV